MFGVPQCSMAVPIFFNVYTCDMFIQIDTSEFSNYADDDTPFTSNYADDDTPFASAQNHEKQVNSLKSTLNGVLEKTTLKPMQINVIYF